MPSLAKMQPDAPRLSPGLMTVVVLVHAGLLGGLLNAQPRLAEPVVPPRPLMMSLIAPEIEAPQPQPQPEPKPRPPEAVSKPLPPPPVLTAQRPLPTPEPQPVAETPQPLSEPVAEALPPSAPARVEAPKTAPSAAPPTPPRPADYLANPKPSYPSLSRRLGEEGTVRLNILVNPDGSVARLELAKSSGYPRLDRSAIDTVQSSWKFEPARQGGMPVAAWVIVPIQFTLRS
jgi:protein TonB